MLAVLLRWHVRVIESVRGLLLMMLPTPLPPLERDLLLSAALVSLALFGAFVSCAGVKTVDVSTPKIFMGLNVGAILVFSHDHEECGQCRLENGGRS
ncbi:putative inorganic diphosphatase [Helianthus annuus]|uniref:H(+)-exporting diphosphatase n=1 Tax=Helianthus annuus TaxID=4232 RepID=A0A251UHN4_HELAN|nr:putative inorganic diphosphatase [Helianthus annuus]KAJ0566680.1 putative inorganic diphosphatase [Helianthus annuus]KAJ0573391.1 putative inorganic diphosphatase [Helianthus annuus]KAJ0911698.1 putative inorganic diphosphatase [Helianthus annuus]